MCLMYGAFWPSGVGVFNIFAYLSPFFLVSKVLADAASQLQIISTYIS